jgi:hypothetical protein
MKSVHCTRPHAVLMATRVDQLKRSILFCSPDAEEAQRVRTVMAEIGLGTVILQSQTQSQSQSAPASWTHLLLRESTVQMLLDYVSERASLDVFRKCDFQMLAFRSLQICVAFDCTTCLAFLFSPLCQFRAQYLSYRFPPFTGSLAKRWSNCRDFPSLAF